MRNKILLFCLILWIAFIFFNSLQPGNISGANSGRIVDSVSRILSVFKIEIKYNTLSMIIRKGAHIFEFMVLSILFMLVLMDFDIIHRIFLSSICSISIAIIDETIQLFVRGRSGSIIDVGIDTIGIIFGIGVGLLLNRFIMKKNYDI